MVYRLIEKLQWRGTYLNKLKIVDVNEENLNDRGCYCLCSKAISTGYINKNDLRLLPTHYGIYGVIYKNKLIKYHMLTVHSAIKRLKAQYNKNIRPFRADTYF